MPLKNRVIFLCQGIEMLIFLADTKAKNMFAVVSGSTTNL